MAFFLPMGLIYRGKTSRSFPWFKFPNSFTPSASEKHYRNKEESSKQLDEVIIPSINAGYIDNSECTQRPNDHPFFKKLYQIHDRSKRYFPGLLGYASTEFVFNSVFIFLKNYLPKILITKKRKPKCKSLKLHTSNPCVI